jgi:hypothetical protein
VPDSPDDLEANNSPPQPFGRRDEPPPNSLRRGPPDQGFVSGPPLPAPQDAFASASIPQDNGIVDTVLHRTAMLGSMGLNLAMLNDPGELPSVLASARGQSVSSGRMEATLTVTPSQDLLIAFAEVQERVRVLEGLMAWMPPPDRNGIGGNFPPEPIEDVPLSATEWSELRRFVVVLRSQKATPEQTPIEAMEVESRLKAFADRIRSFLGRCADDYRSGFIRGLGTLTTGAAVLYGHSALSHLADVLAGLSDALRRKAPD